MYNSNKQKNDMIGLNRHKWIEIIAVLKKHEKLDLLLIELELYQHCHYNY